MFGGDQRKRYEARPDHPDNRKRQVINLHQRADNHDSGYHLP